MACNVRERNGYGIVTTQYSITSIGRNFEGGHAAKREKAEAAVRTFKSPCLHVQSTSPHAPPRTTPLRTYTHYH
jgi:hypothetical protein